MYVSVWASFNKAKILQLLELDRISSCTSAHSQLSLLLSFFHSLSQRAGCCLSYIICYLVNNITLLNRLDDKYKYNASWVFWCVCVCVCVLKLEQCAFTLRFWLQNGTKNRSYSLIKDRLKAFLR